MSIQSRTSGASADSSSPEMSVRSGMPMISLSSGERRPCLEQDGCHQTRQHEQGRFAAEKQICSRAEALAAWSGLCEALKHSTGPGGAAGSCWGGGWVGSLIKPFRRSVGVGCEQQHGDARQMRPLSAAQCSAVNQLLEKEAPGNTPQKGTVFCSSQQRGTPGRCLNSGLGELLEAAKKLGIE